MSSRLASRYPDYVRLAPVLAFLCALLLLGIGITRTPVTGAVTDPVGHLRAQDEALYANAALDFSARGGWLTPRFLGRYLLYKPPLAAWLGGASLKLFGVSLWALRLPFLLASASLCLLVFLWLRREANGIAAWAGVLLLCGNTLMQVFSRLAYTDILVALGMAGALLCEAPLVSGAFVAVAILAKNVAGLLPLVVLLFLPEGRRRWWRTAFWAFVFAAPWHLYQLIVHREWFWTEYVERQLFAFGAGSIAMQASEDPHASFYGERLWLMDPLLVLLGLLGLLALRKRLYWAWTLVVIAALFGFHYRNLQYVLPLLVVLAIAAAQWRPRLVLTLALLALPVKTLVTGQPWTILWGNNPEPAAMRNVRAYAALDRGQPLVMVEADDEFYASVWPLARIHYYFVDPAHKVSDYAPQYLPLGITMRGDEFRELSLHFDHYAAALRAWGLPSTEPIATAVIDERDQILTTVQARPDCDYYLPERFRGAAPPSTHTMLLGEGGRVFWLSRAVQTPTARRFTIPAGTRW